MSLAGFGVNVSSSRARVRSIRLETEGGPVGSTPFTGEHTVLRLPRHIFAAAVSLGFGGVGVNATVLRMIRVAMGSMRTEGGSVVLNARTAVCVAPATTTLSELE